MRLKSIIGACALAFGALSLPAMGAGIDFDASNLTASKSGLNYSLQSNGTTIYDKTTNPADTSSVGSYNLQFATDALGNVTSASFTFNVTLDGHTTAISNTSFLTSSFDPSVDMGAFLFSGFTYKLDGAAQPTVGNLEVDVDPGSSSSFSGSKYDSDVKFTPASVPLPSSASTGMILGLIAMTGGFLRRRRSVRA